MSANFHSVYQGKTIEMDGLMLTQRMWCASHCRWKFSFKILLKVSF